MKRYAWLGLLLALTLGQSIAGCGGGANDINVSPASSRTGSLSLTITWPAKTRLVPQLTSSILVTLLSGTSTVASQLAVPPTSGNSSIVSFSNVTVGALTLSATAFPNANGTGTALAAGSAPVTVTAGQTATVSVTMASTIDHLTLSPPSPTVAAGLQVDLTPTAYNISGAVVLLSTGKLQWSSDNTAFATVTTTGVVTGVKAGSANIKVTDTESNKSVSTAVTVTTSSTSVPIAVTGFNRDVIFESAAVTSSGTFDDVTDAWIQDGLNGYRGLPAGVFTSRLTNPVTGLSTQYQLQPFTGNNVLMIYPGTPGVLTLTLPSKLRTVSIAAASSNSQSGPGIGTLTLNFTDGSASAAINYNAIDWWDGGAMNDPNRILNYTVYRATNAGTNLAEASVMIDSLFIGYNMYETTIDMSNVGGVDYTGKLPKSVTFNCASGAERTGVFALSGVAAP